jgi:hypothetical protein
MAKTCGAVSNQRLSRWRINISATAQPGWRNGINGSVSKRNINQRNQSGIDNEAETVAYQWRKRRGWLA